MSYWHPRPSLEKVLKFERWLLEAKWRMTHTSARISGLLLQFLLPPKNWMVENRPCCSSKKLDDDLMHLGSKICHLFMLGWWYTHLQMSLDTFLSQHILFHSWSLNAHQCIFAFKDKTFFSLLILLWMQWIKGKLLLADLYSWQSCWSQSENSPNRIGSTFHRESESRVLVPPCWLH